MARQAPGVRQAGAGWQGRAPRREGAQGEGQRPRADPGSQDLRARDRGGSIAGLGARERVARSRILVARGRKPADVARVLQVSRQAIYRTPKRRTDPGPRPVSGPVDTAIVEVAKENPTDGTRMVAALASREIGKPISRKRAQRVMRSERLLQRHRPCTAESAPASSGSSAPTSSGTWT
jgi:hypothetical protein